MYRITAINNEAEAEEEDEIKVTKEAEETIILSEYLRTLKLQKENCTDDALSLFKELLETQILFEVTKSHPSKTLISVKYNCYKNIALIYCNRKDNDLALEFLIKAIELDDTDVYTVNKLGQIALKLKQLDVAQSAFEKCLKTNPTHWPSGDGILQILCQREEYHEAYGWARRWYEKNPKYCRALDVITEIREKFKICGTEYLDNAFPMKCNVESSKRANKSSAFCDPEFSEPIEESSPNVDEFKVESFHKLNWFTLGSMIANLYKYLSELDNGAVLNAEFTNQDFLLEEMQLEPLIDETNVETTTDAEMIDAEAKIPNENVNDIELDDKQENSNSDSKCAISNAEGGNSADGSTAEDSDAPTTGDDGSKAADKPKPRRRGSDLKLLDRWFYWEKRKYSQRQKNKKIERMETDTTINGLLRKTLEKYYEENFDDESPFHPNTSTLTDRAAENSSELEISLQCFQDATSKEFTKLINEIVGKSFTVLTLVEKWIQCVSQFWEQKLPDEVLDLYLQLFQNYLNHHNLSTWNLLNDEDFQNVFQTTLFYLELSHERSLRTAEQNVKNEVDDDWILLYNQIVFHSGVIEPIVDKSTAIKYQHRLLWLQYCLSRYEYDLRRSVNCLETIRDLICTHDDSFVLILHNQAQNSKIDLQSVNESIVMLERMINLNNVHQLYADKQFTELIEILKDSVVNSTKSRKAENSVMKLSEQFEVILECFWSLAMIEECLIWCDRCMKYALDRFIGASIQSQVAREWAKCINFILVYIEAIIVDESYIIVKCLGRYYARLIQSIVRIISNQLDTDERNCNQVHPINLKTPWIILHHILQREEDMKPRTRRKLSNDSISSNEKETSEGEMSDEEEPIPKSISIFFTAHEYLGNRTWCMKDNGQLLLYILDLVTPRLRTPYLERCRNEVIEYLEQITYCLYKYPAKKARLKHLEKHESTNITLDWNHAIQLYDIYRPEKMPEFDMFKRDSITTEMEQLLQHIIEIIPKEIDPSTRSEPMKKFISGEISELPKALDILPYRINTIFYLLADYYFKNKEFSKALDYYISDLSNMPTRFDGWAGLALSKAHLMGTELNSCSITSSREWVQHSEEVLRCFEQCLKIDEHQHVLWIEYGNYAYALHSYCSRNLKQSGDSLPADDVAFMEEKKANCLKITHDCFITIDNLKPLPNDDESENSDDEKWLYHYMLGKVAEKRKQAPEVVIDHYLQSAQYLYDNNASYPFKISSVNPQNLALEALEVFYRITATIIKYLEQHPVVTQAIGKFFIKILKQQLKSPFALSQAKINENILNAHLQRKRKLTMTNEEMNKQKMVRLEAPNTIKNDNEGIEEPAPTTASENDKAKANESSAGTDEIPSESATKMEVDTQLTIGSPEQTKEVQLVEADKTPAENRSEIAKENEPTLEMEVDQLPNPSVASIIEDNIDSPLRRGSQESAATTTTQTSSSTGTDSTSSSSDSSNSSDSSSDSDVSTSEDETNKDENAPLDEKRIDFIYKMCIKNLEECITRYPEHYKSIYRLVVIYMKGPEKVRDVQKCNQLLLGTYTTELGNQVQGLFTDRKNNNLFNGFWRNKSSEIERPGSFSSHLSKCVNVLMHILRANQDYKFLLEIIYYMQRVPDADKRYIKDSERKELLEHSITSCVQAFKEQLKKHGIEQRNDNEILTVLIEIFKAHKKMKTASQKESAFSNILVDAYKTYAGGKARLQENINYLDSANKFSGSLMNGLKNQEKQLQQTGIKQTLEELGLRNLHSSLPKVTIPVPPQVSVITQMPVSAPITVQAETSSVVSVTTATTTTITNTSSIASTATTSAVATVPSRPRGRPPGSRNSTTKSDTTKTAVTQQKNKQASMLQSLAGPLANLDLVTAHLDPIVKATILALLAEPKFMKTLAMFPDPSSRNTLLREYFSISKYPNVQQLIDGFNGVFSYLASALQPQPSLSNLLQTQIKAPKETNPAVPKSSAMSIFPTPNKPHSSLTTSPSKLSINPSISATITPVASSPSLLKPVSTVLSVGSGQLTITPSISITPNPTKLTSVLPQMPAPSFSIQKPAQPKARRSTGDKPTKAQKAQRLSHPIYHSLPNIVENLPKSLSISPSPSSFVPPKAPTPLPMNVDLLVGKPAKQTKQKKKSLDGGKNAAVQPNMPTMDAAMFNKQLQSHTLMSQYLSHYEQFLSSVAPSSLQLPKPPKSKGTALQPQKATIKVKQLDQLQAQGRPDPTIVRQKPGPKPKAKANQTFATSTMAKPPVSRSPKNPPMSRSPSVLNAYGTTISSIAHPNITTPTIPTLQFVPMSISPAVSHPANLQISPTKTLQQKLAERQRQFHDANSQSRPSSASSAGSIKPKSDTEVIVLD